MDCLVAFVVLFVLPLAGLAFAIAVTARRASARLQKRLEEADRRLALLEGAAATAARAAGPAAATTAAAPYGTTERAAAGAEAPTLGDPTAAAATTPHAGPPAAMTGSPPDAPAPLPGADLRTPVTTATGMAAAAGAATTSGPTSPPAPPPPRPPRVSLEEQLGARLPVWIGAVALILAAAFLVKYSVDQGWVGPGVRVTLGSLFGVTLLAGGEMLRRSTARVAQGLTAAGVAVLFVVLWAAMHLYHLIGPGVGFALLALTTATAVVLSLRQGVMVALLGLVGGFLTPTLVATPDPQPGLLFGYLLLVEAGLLAVSRRRRWGALAALNLAGALVWALAWTLSDRGATDSRWLGAFLLASLAAFVLAGWRRAAGDAAPPLPAWLQGAAAGGGLVVAALLTDVAVFGLLEWGFVGLLAAACLALARLRPGLGGLAWLAAAVVTLLLADWASALEPAETTRFLAIAAGALLLLGGGSWALRRGAAAPGRWAALAAAATLAVDLVAYYGASAAGVEMPWGWLQLALATLWTVLALPVARRRGDAGAEESLAAAAVAATTLTSLAVPMELERQWIGVAWALAVAALLWLAGRLRVPVLAPLGAVVAALVGARLLLNPMLFDYPFGDHPLVSWLLYGYGIPIAAFAAAAALARRQGRARLAVGLGGGSIALAVAFLGLAVRQAFHPGAPHETLTHLGEWGALSTAWLALGCGLLVAGAGRFPHPEVRWGGLAVVVLGAGQALLAQGLLANPAWTHLAVGDTPVWNAVLLAYGAPALLLLVAARALRGGRTLRLGSIAELSLAGLAAATALPLVFLLVTLEVRQAFRGTYLDGPDMGSAERYAYSAAWVALGTALLLVGIARGRRSVRLASLPIMVLAVGKVFLYDTAQLSDLYRVFSFLGLGASLLFLAWVYQRFVFRATPEVS